MSNVRLSSLGNFIFEDIEKNEYLLFLYETLVKSYTEKMFFENLNFSANLDDKKINDLLVFADLLSKSNHHIKKGIHKVWSQEIMALLNFLFPDDEKINIYMYSVLTNCNNFPGLKMKKLDDMIAYDFLETVLESAKKETLIIPGYENEYFFGEQKQIYLGLEKENFSYSAPTSMGKSFLMRLFIKDKILNTDRPLNFAIVVPTKALITEVKSKMIDEIKDLLEPKNYRVVSSVGDVVLEFDHNFVFIMTPERLLYLISTKPDTNIEYLFIDEAHKISNSDARSTFYYSLLNKLQKREEKPHIYFSSPHIPNPEVFLKLLNNNDNDADNLSSKHASYSPVSQLKYMINNETNTINFFNEYSNSFIETGQIAKDFNLADLLTLLSKYKKNLVYFNSIDRAIDAALEYSKELKDSEDRALITLASDIEREVHSDYYLAKLIRKGIAYHVGYLPSNIRMRIEEQFKTGNLTTIFCTSTLIEGVNLPADNLIITSYKTSRKTLDAVSFRNLIGRVGRLEHNLYGNVFFIKHVEEEKYEPFNKLLTMSTPEQKLSVEKEFTKKNTEKIVSYLSNGEIELGEDEFKGARYSFFRKMSMILIEDLETNNLNSVVLQTVREHTADDNLELIKSNFSNLPKGSGLDITYDQTSNLREAIKSGLTYPNKTSAGYFEHRDIVNFLNKLAEIFRWEIYEKDSLGRINKEGKLSSLSMYAVILGRWMQGFGLSNIISYTIDYKEKFPKTGVWSRNQQISKFYDRESLKHKNYVISDTLYTIDNVILFNVANYFREFSLEYKLFHRLDSFDNDWYEYVEYGTMNELSIMLQRIGYSRESATKIRSNKDKFIIEKKNEISSFSLFAPALLDNRDHGIRMETADIVRNMPEIFVFD